MPLPTKRKPFQLTITNVSRCFAISSVQNDSGSDFYAPTDRVCTRFNYGQQYVGRTALSVWGQGHAGLYGV